MATAVSLSCSFYNFYEKTCNKTRLKILALRYVNTYALHLITPVAFTSSCTLKAPNIHTSYRTKIIL